MKPIHVGEDPTNVENLFRKMGPSIHYNGGQRIHAISGIEIALWDITGKAFGLPVYKLLGGKYRDKVRVYCCTPRHNHKTGKLIENTPEAYAETAKEFKKFGFSIMKLGIGADTAREVQGGVIGSYVTKKGLQRELNYIEAIQEALGYDAEIALDGSQYNIVNAIRFLNAVEKFNLVWVEDVLPADCVEAWREVTSASKTPTLTGEGIYLRQGFVEYIQRQAVRIVAPDFQWIGGLSEGKKIAEMADLYHMLVAPHNASSPIGIMAAVHACAAIPNFLALEYHYNPAWERLIKHERPIMQDGFIKVPEEAGLGVELNEKELSKYLREGETPL